MRAPGRTCAAAILLAAAGGCFDPTYEPCRAACTSDEDCAPGHACGAAGLCAAPDEPLACGGAAPGPRVSPAGAYTFTLTNQDNGCALPDWEDDCTTTTSVDIRDDGARVVAEPQGTMASILKTWLGAHAFTGPSQGAQLELVLAGERTVAHQSCTFTFDLAIDAVLDGDLLEGSLFYRARTNGDRACGVLNGCASRQSLLGTRTSP